MTHTGKHSTKHSISSLVNVQSSSSSDKAVCSARHEPCRETSPSTDSNFSWVHVHYCVLLSRRCLLSRYYRCPHYSAAL